MEILLAVFILTFIFSAFFSGSEVAILSVTHIKAKQLAHQRMLRAKSLLYLKEHQNETIITILIGNNIVNILSAVIATKLTIDYFGDVYLGLATGIVTFLTLTFGEILPKILASKSPVKIALAVSPIILFLGKLFIPIVWFFNGIARMLNKVFKAKSPEPLVTERDIKYLVKIGEKEGEINEREKEIINNVFKFNDIKVETVMTKREAAFALDWNMNIKDAYPLLEEQAFSRIPVYDKDINNMKGIVRVQDVMIAGLRNEGDKALKTITEYTVFLHPDKKIDHALKMMQLRHVHMAIVIDKKRRFKGVITMEDIIEELVGEIFDESDRVDYLVKRIGKNEWVVSTRIDLRGLNKKLKLHLPITNDFKTLATLLKEKIPSPKIGSEFLYKRDKVSFVARRLFEGNIQQVVIRKKK